MKPISLTNTVALELEGLHGSQDKALAFRHRSWMAARPADGRGSVKERVLVLSDLHIGIGLNPESELYFPEEDFFTGDQSRQLLTFLSREWRAAKSGDAGGTSCKLILPNGYEPTVQEEYGLTLCLNGDIFDFSRSWRSRPGMPFPDGIYKNAWPKETPANNLAKLNMMYEGHPEVFRALARHLSLGHKLDYIPGNHDRCMYNPLIWSGELALQNGKKYLGFTKILERELSALGLGEAEVARALRRATLRPMAFYADKMVDHGDSADAYNRPRRPYLEAVDPTPAHDEIPTVFGDLGIRKGFQQLEVADPTLSAIDNGALFFWRVMKHPVKTGRLLAAMLGASTLDGFDPGTGSPAADSAQRLKDIASLVERFPEIGEQLNAMRPDAEKLSEEQVISGLQEIERHSATPFYSNFERGVSLLSCFLFRHSSSSLKRSRGRQVAVETDRLAAANKAFGINDLLGGHTHHAGVDTVLTPDEKALRYINTHTWTDKVGSWGRPSITWGPKDRGVGVIEIGVDEYGRPWSSAHLERVIDAQGDLVPGDLLEDPEINTKQAQKTAHEIFAQNRGDSLAFEAGKREAGSPFTRLEETAPVVSVRRVA